MQSEQAKMARRLREQLGFDKSYVCRDSDYVKLGCSQCQPMAVNGVPIHERGCPNERKKKQ